MKFKMMVLLIIAGVMISGCNATSRAMDWAEQAVSRSWQAQYRIVFHQEDEDIEMTVREFRGETLVLEIDMPNGSLRLEYGKDNLLIDLDQGGLEWQDYPQQAPYYTLSQLSLQIIALEKLEGSGQEAIADEYMVLMERNFPKEVKWMTEWTLYVDEFHWN